MARLRAALVLVGAVVGLLGVGGCESTVQLKITSVSGDRDAKRLQFVTHLCRYDVQARVIETATQVRLKAPETEFTGGEPDCIGGGVVTLERPLGDRVVIDDATGQQVPFADP